MDYRVASNIRGKSLSSLMTDRITEGGSIGSSIKGAISDKLKAKGTGIKEKFDPMNIARAMTGGGKLAPAILGRMTGRSQSDINYFAGNKNKASSYTQMPQMTTPPVGGLGCSAVEVLNKMLSFMQKNREEDVKYKETEMSFQEENQSEEERRHDQFLKVLKDYTSLSGGTTTMVKKEPEKEESLFDKIANLFSKGAFLARILPFLTNPLTLTIGAVLAAAYGLQKVADFIPNANIRTPLEAQAVLEKGTQLEIDKDGGYDFLAKRITEGPEEAQKTLDDFAEGKISFKELQSRGGESRLKEIASQKGLEVPTKRYTMKDMKTSVTPRDIFAGTGSAKESNEQKWDRDFGPYYDPKTGKRLDLLNTPTTSNIPETNTPVPETNTPVPSEPPSSAVVGKIQENNDLTMNALATSGGSSSGPSVSVSNTSSSEPDKIVTSTATTRDDTPILNRVFDRVRGGV